MTSVSTQVCIRNRLGLHARAAIKLVELVQEYDADVVLQSTDKSATADSVMAMLMLESAQGETITVSASGPQATTALDAVKALFEAGFDEDS
ncbi:MULTISPECIES: HPr family phosphocarrier protein [unclassified Salinivibrio]|uniref:HPr family phosphocarrier protein n=1 Tax=unclassified Salinivibrio TaxID=2636825 RepID=UPI0006148F3D|nr:MULTISPECIES: HPr family phosphocarrier protein [unclassified Salinivibrio]MPS33419.1 HPr family phosphocarrier protein [Salinivibrio sp. VYel7]MPX91702.1 HPr family phosphocarrier protein [Salinivibrio sp. VYel1]MPX94803.1 HPr family phosphocarrier protein [Salinivibrio sp. VYel9]MPX97572.1 HPr family phosphocarrier protein [Salinivibrio sp. VYel6]MPY01090.1 HPr family phosphocarrier protein [Salinivibrio sp. VYel4]MPY04102.1 HPr family phosphocarrier protein [Salinivibrio sp. VYel5]MPY0